MLPDDAFESHRPHLTAIAFRLLGSVHDAEDAVQTAWIKAASADPDGVRNTAAWLTTIVTRVCLDQLRARDRRNETALPEDADRLLDADAVQADESYLRREDVSRGLMVLLDRLTAPQRVAYVLHDLFAVPFADIAPTLRTSVPSAKKHASRARERVDAATPPPISDIADEVVEAFLAAAAGGDIGTMITLLSDDCVRVVDPSLVPPGVPTTVRGARAIAEETTAFADRIRTRVRVVEDGRPVHVLAPGGHRAARVLIDVREGLVARIEILTT